MKYFKKTLEYLFRLEHGKRLAVLCILAIPAGLGASLTAPTAVYYNYFANFDLNNLTFLNTFALGDYSDLIFMLIAGVVTFIAMILSVSVISSVVSRNLRVGVFKLNLRLGYEINEAIIPSFSGVITAFILVVLAKVLVSALFVLAQAFTSTALAITMCVSVLLIMVALVSVALSLGILYLPYMTFNGLNPISAVTKSVHRTESVISRIFPCVFLPILLKYAIGATVALVGNGIVSLIVESVVNTLVLVYLTTLSFVSYYEINELPREDYPRDYFYAKIRR